MLQASGMSKHLDFERISIAVDKGIDRRKVCEEFILSQGLSAHALRWDYLYGVEWLEEMLPSDWSDFDGWKADLEEWSRAVEIVKTAARSSIEEMGLKYRRRGLFFNISGSICVIAGLVIIWRFTVKKGSDRDRKNR